MRFSNDINLALDNHDNVFLVLLDSSTAFDTLAKGVLVKRLHTRFGLRISVLAWNEPYLANRLQSTVIRDVHSSLANSLYRVPQGSVLGPLLFSLYVASIEDLIITRGVQSMIFSEDTQMYLVMRRSEQSSCLSKLELCTQDILSWMT